MVLIDAVLALLHGNTGGVVSWCPDGKKFYTKRENTYVRVALMVFGLRVLRMCSSTKNNQHAILNFAFKADAISCGTKRLDSFWIPN